MRTQPSSGVGGPYQARDGRPASREDSLAKEWLEGAPFRCDFDGRVRSIQQISAANPILLTKARGTFARLPPPAPALFATGSWASREPCLVTGETFDEIYTSRSTHRWRDVRRSWLPAAFFFRTSQTPAKTPYHRLYHPNLCTA